MPIRTTADSSASAAGAPSYNECRYALYDAETNCRSDRNCADCLTKKGCRIGTGGFCEPDTSNGSDALDYKRAVVTNVSQPRDGSASARQAWHFPALETKYCGGDDAVCNRCSERNYGSVASSDDEGDSRFCVGTGGCVCVQNCKNSFLEEAYCDAPGSASQAPVGGSVPADGSEVDGGAVARVPSSEVARGKSDSTSAGAGVWAGGAVAVVVVAAVLAFVYKRRRSRRGRRFEGVPQDIDDDTMKTGTA